MLFAAPRLLRLEFINGIKRPQHRGPHYINEEKHADERDKRHDHIYRYIFVRSLCDLRHENRINRLHGKHRQKVDDGRFHIFPLFACYMYLSYFFERLSFDRKTSAI